MRYNPFVALPDGELSLFSPDGRSFFYVQYDAGEVTLAWSTDREMLRCLEMVNLEGVGAVAVSGGCGVAIQRRGGELILAEASTWSEVAALAAGPPVGAARLDTAVWSWEWDDNPDEPDAPNRFGVRGPVDRMGAVRWALRATGDRWVRSNRRRLWNAAVDLVPGA